MPTVAADKRTTILQSSATQGVTRSPPAATLGAQTTNGFISPQSSPDGGAGLAIDRALQSIAPNP